MRLGLGLWLRLGLGLGLGLGLEYVACTAIGRTPSARCAACTKGEG